MILGYDTVDAEVLAKAILRLEALIGSWLTGEIFGIRNLIKGSS